MRFAVTGAAGFVGGALVRKLLEQGHEVGALIRNRAKIEPRPGLAIIDGDLANHAALKEIVSGADAFIHLAGVTHPRAETEYAKVNIEGAANAAAAAREAGVKFVHASSLSARKPDVSPYANSKWLSEAAVAEASGDNAWVALRLPAIYGPGDHGTLPFFKLVNAGFALAPRTTPPARASLLYVDDAAGALIAAATGQATGRVFEVGDDTPSGRSWMEIGETLGNIMNKKVIRLAMPRPAVALFHNISRGSDRLLGRTPSVRSGQVNEFFHHDWSAGAPLFTASDPWRPETSLEEGFAKTVRWYQDNALL